ncbi:MAG TPA: hypothetical protein VIS07_11380 [Candidatus Binatia bacterium]
MHRAARRTTIDELRERAARRARLALGRFGNGVAHVVLRDRGADGTRQRCRTLVGVVRSGAVSFEEPAPA